jgi:sulfite exporter TauE/SafE
VDFNGLSLGALALAGLVGSFGHCVGMCGPLVTILGVTARRDGWRLHLRDHALYHASRVSVYALLGLAAGAVGTFVRLGSGLSTAAGLLSLVLGAMVMVLGVTFVAGTGWAGRALWGGEALTGAMSHAVKRGGVSGVMALGALNGLLPCGLVYSALLAVAAGGSPLGGAVAMIVFGAATIPVLITVGLGASRLGARPRAVLTRVAGALIVLVGAQLALRGAAELSLLPHLQLGGLMLW